MELAIGYARVSTNDQVRYGVSLPMQVEKIKRQAIVADVELIDVLVEEGVSGMKHLSQRPKGQQLLRAIKENNVRHIIIWRIDRAFRNASDALKNIDTWSKQDISVSIVDMGGAPINTSTATGKFMISIMVALAEMERNLTAERTSAALRHIKETGGAYTHPPLGFTRVGDEFIANPNEQDLLRHMWELHKSGCSYRKIAIQLKKNNIYSKRGGQNWHPYTIQTIIKRINRDKLVPDCKD
ncbi:MAG TPA: recombinase family protein [Bacilli bacterium]